MTQTITTNYHKADVAAPPEQPDTGLRGPELLDHPVHNKGTAFSTEERECTASRACWPIVYEPMVAEACLTFGHIYRRARGMYITRDMKGRMAEVLRNWPVRDVRFICVSTGDRRG
jgi:malic enzyme